MAGRRSTMPMAAALALALLLGGCAAQLAYRDGRALVDQGQVEAGLVKLQQAVAAEPGNARYKAAYLAERERAVNASLAQAQRAAAAQPQRARQLYQDVLAIDPYNARAASGLRLLDTAARHQTMLADAARAGAAGQEDLARQTLKAILVEHPGHQQAGAQLRQIDATTPAAAVEAELARALRQPLTIEFRDASLKQVFEVLARRSGLNFIFDKDVKSDLKTSIFLKNSHVEAALYFLLVSNQLERQVMDGNTILIYPNTAAKLKEYQEAIVKTFFLANADAKLVANTVRTILKTRDIVVDEKLNLLIMRDSPEAVKLAERLINLQDVPEPEVMLDVEVLEIKRSRLIDLGVKWPLSVSLTPLTAAGGSALTVNDLRHLNGERIGVAGLGWSVDANKADGDANLLANPRIRVRNREKAKILIGDKLPVITSTISPGSGGFLSESVSYVDVGLTLNAEPTIYLNNEVAIRIALEVSNLVSQTQTKSGTIAYQIGTRQASTMLQLKDGENQVLAGLINNEERSAGDKVPGLGDLPLLGRLFGSTRDDRQKTEIVLSITPHLVRNVQRPEAALSEFSAGTEASFRRRPDFGARPPALAPSGPAPVPALVPGTVIVRSGAAATPAPEPGAIPVSPAASWQAPQVSTQVTEAAPPATVPVSEAPLLDAPVPAPAGAPPSSSQPAPLPFSASQPVTPGQRQPAPPAAASTGMVPR